MIISLYSPPFNVKYIYTYRYAATHSYIVAEQICAATNSYENTLLQPYSSILKQWLFVLGQYTHNFHAQIRSTSKKSYLGGGCSVVIAHLGLYTSDIGLGQWVNIIHETVCRQWFGVV